MGKEEEEHIWPARSSKLNALGRSSDVVLLLPPKNKQTNKQKKNNNNKKQTQETNNFTAAFNGLEKG